MVFRGLANYEIDGSRDLSEFICELAKVKFTEGVGLPGLQVQVEVLLWDSQCEPFIAHLD